MKNFILNPDCSEVVFRPVCDITREELMKELASIGIFEITLSDSDENKTVLFDIDNPNIPDIAKHSELYYLEENIYAMQHHQSQMYATMYKIEEHISGDWEAYGGHTLYYEEWKKDEKYKEIQENFQNEETVKLRNRLIEDFIREI